VNYSPGIGQSLDFTPPSNKKVQADGRTKLEKVIKVKLIKRWLVAYRVEKSQSPDSVIYNTIIQSPSSPGDLSPRLKHKTR
jgi:hypothetical protein